MGAGVRLGIWLFQTEERPKKEVRNSSKVRVTIRLMAGCGKTMRTQSQGQIQAMGSRDWGGGRWLPIILGHKDAHSYTGSGGWPGQQEMRGERCFSSRGSQLGT